MIKIHKSEKLAVSFVAVLISAKIDKTKSLAFYDQAFYLMNKTSRTFHPTLSLSGL